MVLYHSLAIALASTQHKHSPYRIIILDLAIFFRISFSLSSSDSLHFSLFVHLNRLDCLQFRYLTQISVIALFFAFDIWFLFIAWEQKVNMNAKPYRSLEIQLSIGWNLTATIIWIFCAKNAIWIRNLFIFCFFAL